MKQIPAVHELLKQPSISEFIPKFSRNYVVDTTRRVLSHIRQEMLANASAVTPDEIRIRIVRELTQLTTSHFRRVINATGTLIHTNLGRAPLSKEALAKMVEVGIGYSTVEYDLKEGRRGERNDHLEFLLCLVTGAESALVVNNNAAAVLLCLNTLADGKEVIVSRGELVEIGNSFRIPDIMNKSGAILKEVGATNKTRFADYENHVSDSTALILKVHTSNYEIKGFTEDVSLKKLVSLGAKMKRPVMFDAGSGCLLTEGIHKEPAIQQAIQLGADVVTFSGDKLLGGPQSGIIVGKSTTVDRFKKNPLYRTQRIDKLLLAALEVTLRHYLSGEATEKIPFMRMLNQSPEEVHRAASEMLVQLKGSLKDSSSLAVCKDVSRIGGGALPNHEIPTFVLSINLPDKKLRDVERRLRLPADPKDIPIISRIHKGSLRLDLRTIQQQERKWVVKRLISLRHVISSGARDPSLRSG